MLLMTTISRVASCAIDSRRRVHFRFARKSENNNNFAENSGRAGINTFP